MPRRRRPARSQPQIPGIEPLPTLKRRVGRVERALSEDLRGETTIPTGGRAHLRAAAHLVDLAEAAEDIDGGAKIIGRYLELRQAYGLAGSVGEPLDPFAAFVAGMSTAQLRDN